MADVQLDEFWNKTLRQAKELDTRGTGLTAEIRATDSSGDVFISKVEFGNAPCFLPVRVERISENSKLKATFVMDEYESRMIEGKLFYWPKAVRILAGAGDTVLGELRFKTLQWSVNTPNPKGIFTLDITSADTIYDEDVRTIIRSRRQLALPSDLLGAMLPPRPSSRVHSTASQTQLPGYRQLMASTLTGSRGVYWASACCVRRPSFGTIHGRQRPDA